MWNKRGWLDGSEREETLAKNAKRKRFLRKNAKKTDFFLKNRNFLFTIHKKSANIYTNKAV